MSTIDTCWLLPPIALTGWGGTRAGGGTGAGVAVAGVAVAAVDDTGVLPVVLVVFVVAAGVFPWAVEVTAGLSGTGLARSGKNLGAAHRSATMKRIERATADVSRFSILWDGVPTSRIENIAA